MTLYQQLMMLFILMTNRRDCDRLVVEFTTTYAISASPEMLMITKMISNLSTDMRNMIGK